VVASVIAIGGNRFALFRRSAQSSNANLARTGGTLTESGEISMNRTTPHPHLHSIGKHLFVDDGTIYGRNSSSVWEVWAADKMTHLGSVKWLGRWRCYAFRPATNTLFEKQCLRDLATFCERQTKAQFDRAKMLRERDAATAR
jgi:hypothetical protein